jgi:hypothetical protein
LQEGGKLYEEDEVFFDFPIGPTFPCR